MTKKRIVDLYLQHRTQTHVERISSDRPIHLSNFSKLIFDIFHHTIMEEIILFMGSLGVHEQSLIRTSNASADL